MWGVGRLKKCGYERLTSRGMIVIACCLTVLLLIQTMAPIRDDGHGDAAEHPALDPMEAFVGDPNASVAANSDSVLLAWRQGLFRSASPLRDRPMADKTIEKIRSQLTLQCVMEMNGQPVAYIHLKDGGLKRCRIGDSVDDLFTVLDIGPKSVDVSILEHKVKLNL
jgi:hypothetical protein